MNEEKKYKVAIVDDDKFLVDMYASKFGLFSVEVEAFNSTESFFEKLKSGLSVDLILLDIVMPGMTGLEALVKMRNENIGAGIPIVMLTNQNDEKDINLAKENGVVGYIVKSSATPSEVVNQVLDIIRKK
jgi:CheY-like chemotaxis protein